MGDKKYSYKKILNLPLEKIESKLSSELAKQGFGVMVRIDVKEVMKEKLNVNYDDYLILGVCNPNFADKALKAEKEMGLFMPCNIVIYKIEDEKYCLSALMPSAVLPIEENEKLKCLAEGVEEALKKAIDSV